MCNSDESSDKNADRIVDSENWAHEVSERNEDSPRNWSRGHLCYILANSSAIFCSYAKTLCEVEFKADGLINLVEKISRQ